MKRALGLAAAFVAVSGAVAADWTAVPDRAVALAVVGARNAALSHIAVNLTSLGSDPVVILAVLFAVLYSAAAGRPARIVPLIAAPAGAFLTNTLAKLVIHHPRPDGGSAIIVMPASFGFPSGHTAAASAVWLTLAFIATRTESRPQVRQLLVGAALATALLVAWSRVYLGVHYLSDVIGGLLLGSAWALGLAYVSRAAAPPLPPPPARSSGPHRP
jgi:undecaprenyl-diphosphatase